MTEKLKQTIKEEVGKLTKENQEVINTFGWEKISEEIGKKYLLSDSEINIFQAEILVVLVGLEDSDFLVSNIEDNIGTSKEEANKITDEVFQRIFMPINDILIENIKTGMAIKNSNAEQNLNFVLSGGDYTAFLGKLEEMATPKTEISTIDKTSTTPMMTPSLADIKANAQKTKITDIKSKFSI